MQKTIAWLGLDAHAKHCLLAQLDNDGNRVGHWLFETKETELIARVQAIAADEKRLALEECGIGRWIGKLLAPYVAKVVVSDPRHNRLVSHNPHKCDVEDGYNLARLLRLGELKAIWQCEQTDRLILKAAARNYLAAVERQTALKLQLKAQYRYWGVMVSGQSVYHPKGRQQWLAKLPNPEVRRGVELHYQLLDQAIKSESLCRRLLTRQGRRYPEIGRLRCVPGVGPIGAHLFVAFIGNPRRFAKASQLIRYCQLAIRDRSSDGKPLGYERLDRGGLSVLKAISYRAWLMAMKRRSGPIYEFYRQSLERTDELHARLNTQRKILVCMWQLWMKEEVFDPKRFLGTASQTA